MKNLTIVDANIKNEIELQLLKRLGNKDSRDFLDGFPWPDKWFQTKLELSEFTMLFTFWDGIAWGLSRNVNPFTVAEAARYLENENNRAISTGRIKNIRDIENNILKKALPLDPYFLFLVGQDQNSPLLIIDGNHRAVAAQLIKMKDNNFPIPLESYIAFSENMNKYRFYQRITAVPTLKREKCEIA